jgi:hypothetical protein
MIQTGLPKVENFEIKYGFENVKKMNNFFIVTCSDSKWISN